jgi:lysophospholipid acyltransferase (LPLAT)-like uncharacterized protein
MHRLLIKVLAFFFNWFLRLTCRLNKVSITGQDIFEKYVEQGNNIFAFWHSRLFFFAYYYASNAKRKVSVLVSMSRDGDYGVALAHKLKQDVVRGSTSRGGQAAIRNLAARVAAGNNIAITPDGPRGPAFKVNEGVIKLAQLTGARIFPASYNATHKKILKSWDRFILVKPFGRVHMAFAKPIEIPKKMNADEVESYRRNLEQTLLKLDRICAEQLNLDGDKGSVVSVGAPIEDNQKSGNL